MRGIILAAGRGSRLQALTDDRPKCMVELSGKSLLHWQLEAMRSAEVERVSVVCGYLGHMVQGEFDVFENPRWAQTHMVASLMCASSWLKKYPCIVSYADIVYPSEAIVRLSEANVPLAVLYDVGWKRLWESRFSNPLEDAESFSVSEDGLIKDIGRKNVSINEIQGQYMGLLRFTPESISWVNSLLSEENGLVDGLDMTGLLSRLIRAGNPVVGIPWDGVWCEVDNERDLAVANELWPHCRKI